MDAIDVLRTLGETTLAGSLAALLAIVLARPVRRRCGAGAAYGLWWSVPLAMLAVLLPARTVMEQAEPSTLSAVLPAAGTLVAAMPAADAGQAGIDWTWWLLAAWTTGAGLVLLHGLHAHRRFVASLGRLRPGGDGLFESDAVEGLPAVVGWRARIVLPADFAARYSPLERSLVLAHERVHVARRDLWFNALAALLCAVHWFNPLAWWALRRFRVAQELACDAAVLAGAPEHRRCYGEALLKTHVIASPASLACQWPGTHPLKERIRMLESKQPARARRRIGNAFVAALAAACSLAAWAAQPARPLQDDPGNATTLPGEPAPGEAAAADAGQDALRLEFDAVSGTLDVEVRAQPADRLLRLFAERTGRTLEVAEGVDLRKPVSTTMDRVPVSVFETLVAEELGVGIRSDATTIRVLPAATGGMEAERMLFDVSLRIDAGDDVGFAPRLIASAGEPFSVVQRGEDGRELRVEMTANVLEGGQVLLSGRIARDGRILAEPALTVREGANGASVRIAGEAPLTLEVEVARHVGPLPAS